MVTTLAGKAGVSGSADGKGAAARFNDPGHRLRQRRQRLRRRHQQQHHPQDHPRRRRHHPGRQGRQRAASTAPAPRRASTTPAASPATLPATSTSPTPNNHTSARSPRRGGHHAGRQGRRGNTDGTGAAASFSTERRLRSTPRRHLRRRLARIHDPQDHAGRGRDHPGRHVRDHRQLRRHRRRGKLQQSRAWPTMPPATSTSPTRATTRSARSRSPNERAPRSTLGGGIHHEETATRRCARRRPVVPARGAGFGQPEDLLRLIPAAATTRQPSRRPSTPPSRPARAAPCSSAPATSTPTTSSSTDFDGNLQGRRRGQDLHRLSARPVSKRHVS